MRDGHSSRCPEAICRLCVVNVEEKSRNFQGGEVATSADRLSGDVFNGLASVEANDVIFALM